MKSIFAKEPFLLQVFEYYCFACTFIFYTSCKNCFISGSEFRIFIFPSLYSCPLLLCYCRDSERKNCLKHIYAQSSNPSYSQGTRVGYGRDDYSTWNVVITSGKTRVTEVKTWRHTKDRIYLLSESVLQVATEWNLKMKTRRRSSIQPTFVRHLLQHPPLTEETGAYSFLCQQNWHILPFIYSWHILSFQIIHSWVYTPIFSLVLCHLILILNEILNFPKTQIQTGHQLIRRYI